VLPLPIGKELLVEAEVQIILGGEIVEDLLRTCNSRSQVLAFGDGPRAVAQQEGRLRIVGQDASPDAERHRHQRSRKWLLSGSEQGHDTDHDPIALGVEVVRSVVKGALDDATPTDEVIEGAGRVPPNVGVPSRGKRADRRTELAKGEDAHPAGTIC
jgi:hypothetical protein